MKAPMFSVVFLNYFLLDDIMHAKREKDLKFSTLLSKAQHKPKCA